MGRRTSASSTAWLLGRELTESLQGPTNSTLHAFLSLLLSPPTSSLHPTPDLPLIALIVQLTPLVEQRREKCSAYFPRIQGETWEVKPALDSTARSLWVRLDSKDESEARRVSRISLGWAGDAVERQVTHVEYLHWGDHGAPCARTQPVQLADFATATSQACPTRRRTCSPLPDRHFSSHPPHKRQSWCTAPPASAAQALS